jgi:hypothetical protein
MNETTSEIAAFDVRVDELASVADPALPELLADDFIYVHSTSARQDKSEWLAGLEPLAGKRKRVASNVQVDLHGDIAVAMGDLDVVWEDRPTAKNRYVRIYRLVNGRWLVIAQRTVPGYDRK